MPKTPDFLSPQEASCYALLRRRKRGLTSNLLTQYAGFSSPHAVVRRVNQKLERAGYACRIVRELRSKVAGGPGVEALFYLVEGEQV